METHTRGWIKDRFFVRLFFNQSNVHFFLCLTVFLFLIIPAACAGQEQYQELACTDAETNIWFKGILPENITFDVKRMNQGIYDLSLHMQDGTTYQPDVNPVLVEITSKEPQNVYHLIDGNWEHVSCKWDGNKIRFAANHFSLYAFTKKTKLLINPEELENAVLEKKVISLRYLAGNSFYSAEEYLSTFQVELPSTIQSGNLAEHSEAISKAIGKNVPYTFWTANQNGLMKKVAQVFQTKNGLYYSSCDFEESSYMGDSDQAECMKMTIAMEITENMGKLDSGEFIAVVFQDDDLESGSASLSSSSDGTDTDKSPSTHILHPTNANALDDIVFYTVDATSNVSVVSSLCLYNESNEIIWSSSMNTVHTIPSSQIQFEAGRQYRLRETFVENGYSLPGFPWMISVGEDFSLSMTEETQQGQGCAESLGIVQQDQHYEILQEVSPHVYLHYQTEGNTVDEVELMAGNLDTGCHVEIIRDGYTLLGWSVNEKELSLENNIVLDVSAGAENHLYAVWHQNLQVFFHSYEYGDYEHAERVEGSEQQPDLRLPMKTDLLIPDNIQEYINFSMLNEDMIFAFAALVSHPLEKIKHIRKNEDLEHASVYWEISDNGLQYEPLNTGEKVILYVYRGRIEIPVHVFEIGINGEYDLKDEEWRAQGFEQFVLDYGMNAMLTPGLEAVREEIVNEVAVHEIAFGTLDGQGFCSELVDAGQAVTYTWQGICVGGEPTGLGRDTVLAYIYFPAVREVPVHIMEYLPNGTAEERIAWMKTDRLFVPKTNILFNGNTSVQALIDMLIKDDIAGTVSLDAVYYGVSFQECSETPVRNIHNTAYGINVNEENEYLTEADSLYFVFYENPRIWPVHLVERTVDGYEDRDSQWNVQPIRVTETKTEILSFDPRASLDDHYALYSVRRCDQLANIGVSSKYKEITHVMNTNKGLSILISGQHKYTQLKDPYQLYFLYYQKERPINVIYVHSAEGMLTPIAQNHLDLSENGNAVLWFPCGDVQYLQPVIGSPRWAVLGNDNTPTYHPSVAYAVGQGGITQIQELTLLDELPWFMNTPSTIKLKEKENSAAKNIGLDKSLYVIYDDSLDSDPAYLRLKNQTDENTYCFVITFDSGRYNGPVLISSSWSGTYVRSEENEYRIQVPAGTEKTVYIPTGANLDYSVKVIDGEGREIQDHLEDYDLELSVQPLSSQLEGNLMEGRTYYWNSETDNVYTSMNDSAQELTLICIQEKTVTIPAPTDSRRVPTGWIILFLLSSCLIFCLKGISHKKRLA